MSILLCSDCFHDHGLRLDAVRLGFSEHTACPNCGSTSGAKLDRDSLEWLVSRFFVHGTIQRPSYGGFPALQFNEHRYPEREVEFPDNLRQDADLLAETLKIGIFLYGPRFWMFGEIEPLKALRRAKTRPKIIARILIEYPVQPLTPTEVFYRLRINPSDPGAEGEYDSPPSGLKLAGRLNTADDPVMYGSQDLELCVHECRVTVDDLAYIATLSPAHPLRLLNLTRLLREDDVTEFESLDLAIQMLFLAGKHSYKVCREIAKAARAAGFDGLIYPSYFTLARTGGMPFPTAYGMSIRRFPSQEERIEALAVPNLALFGRPLADGVVRVRSINRLILNRVAYDIQFGPAAFR